MGTWTCTGRSSLQYYDLPLLSVRSAIYPYMMEGRKGFKVDYASKHSIAWARIETVPPGEDPADRFYADGMHPTKYVFFSQASCHFRV